jgi:RsiW-degrading membrane proteinase PrsW (M82 family)
MAVLYRLYGVYCVLFGFMGSMVAVTAFRRGERWAWWTLFIGNTLALVSAMTYDKMVNAIGPLELTEYLGLVLVWVAFGVTAPVRIAARPLAATS